MATITARILVDQDQTYVEIVDSGWPPVLWDQPGVSFRQVAKQAWIDHGHTATALQVYQHVDRPYEPRPGDEHLARSLADLSPARQWNLLWSAKDRLDIAEGLDPFDPAELVCDPGHVIPAERFPDAHEGSDGLYHLTGYCTSSLEPFVHPSISTPSLSRTSWDPITLDPAPTDPATVPGAQRCPDAAPCWPLRFDRRSRRRRDQVTAAAVDALGRMCSICTARPAVVLDHDHFTGIVRGILCRVCNNVVDRCRHVTGCRFSDYLDNPPGWPLQLRYPDLWRRPAFLERVALLGRFGYNSPRWMDASPSS